MPAATLVDASNLTVMPGLVEWHSHLQPDYGEAQGRRGWRLASRRVRSPGGIPYEAVEERERGDAGISAGSAGLHDRPPDGMAARLLQDGHRALERGAPRDGAAARQGAPVRPAQELRPAAGPRAEARRGVRAQHRHPDLDARGLPGGVRRHGRQRAHVRHEPPRLLAEAGDAAAQLRGRRPRSSARPDRVRADARRARAHRQLYAENPALRQDPRFKLYPQWMQAQVAAAGQGRATVRRAGQDDDGRAQGRRAGGGRHRLAERVPDAWLADGPTCWPG